MRYQSLQLINGAAVSFAILQQSRDILEADARLREIRNHTNIVFKIHIVIS
ncbi:hypothetical protein D3C87_1972660 [compost metagenome]